MNQRADRYAYHVGKATLGDPSSAVRFEEQWQPGPCIDLAAAQDRLRISHRAGCDLAVANFAISLHAEPDGPGQVLARCGDHGPPVVWKSRAPAAG